MAQACDTTHAMPLIPPDRLARADAILFVAHLAIGDFTYLQNFFRAFAQAYPHLKVDLWIDELRRTDDPAKWPFLKCYSLYDWAQSCGCFRKVYCETYSPELLARSIDQARAERYAVVVSLATLRPHNYARLARQLGPQACVAGMQGHRRWYAPWDKLAYAQLDVSMPAFLPSLGEHHITQAYASWFARLFGLQVSQAQRFPFVDIPAQWIDAAQAQCQRWQAAAGVSPAGNPFVFINPYAKDKKRCWPLERVVALIQAMRAKATWRDSIFIVNAAPQDAPKAKAFLAEHALANAHLFSAEDNFFQLPAMLKACGLIISVETAVMHLANAVHTPVLALMRQKNPEWAPFDAAHSTVITAERRRDWVKSIGVDAVLQALDNAAPERAGQVASAQPAP